MLNHENLTPFEKQIMDIVLSGKDSILDILREQYKNASIVGRTKNSFGPSIDFTVPASCPLVDPLNFNITDVDIKIKGIKIMVLTNLFIRDGLISMLEFSTIDEGWPDDPVLEYFTYANFDRIREDGCILLKPAKTRDISYVRKRWIEGPKVGQTSFMPTPE